MPEPGSEGGVVEAGLRVRDLTMWEVFNSGERGLGDWERVLGRVGKGEGGGKGRRLVLERMVKGRGSMLGVMVVGIREGGGGMNGDGGEAVEEEGVNGVGEGGGRGGLI